MSEKKIIPQSKFVKVFMKQKIKRYFLLTLENCINLNRIILKYVQSTRFAPKEKYFEVQFQMLKTRSLLLRFVQFNYLRKNLLNRTLLVLVSNFYTRLVSL